MSQALNCNIKYVKYMYSFKLVQLTSQTALIAVDLVQLTGQIIQFNLAIPLHELEQLIIIISSGCKIQKKRGQQANRVTYKPIVEKTTVIRHTRLWKAK